MIELKASLQFDLSTDCYPSGIFELFKGVDGIVAEWPCFQSH